MVIPESHYLKKTAVVSVIPKRYYFKKRVLLCYDTTMVFLPESCSLLALYKNGISMFAFLLGQNKKKQSLSQ